MCMYGSERKVGKVAQVVTNARTEVCCHFSIGEVSTHHATFNLRPTHKMFSQLLFWTLLGLPSLRK